MLRPPFDRSQLAAACFQLSRIDTPSFISPGFYFAPAFTRFAQVASEELLHAIFSFADCRYFLHAVADIIAMISRYSAALFIIYFFASQRLIDISQMTRYAIDTPLTLAAIDTP